MTINKSRITAAIGAILLLGAVASPASARWGDRDERYGERHGERHGERYDERWEHHHWNGGYTGLRPSCMAIPMDTTRRRSFMGPESGSTCRASTSTSVKPEPGSSTRRGQSPCSASRSLSRCSPWLWP